MKPNIGDTFQGRARNLSSDGSAVVETTGKTPDGGLVFFVEGAWPGDEGIFEVTSLEARYGYAKIQKLNVLSHERVQPPCPYQGHGPGKCGGCPWMMGSYEAQLKHKEHRVRFALQRAKLLSESNADVFKPIWASPETMSYRNRAQFKTDGSRLGFVSMSTSDMIDIEDCLMLNTKMREHLKQLRSMLPNKKWEPTPPHHWNFLDLDDEVNLDRDLVLNKRRPFKQGNTVQNERMKNWVAEKIRHFHKNGAPILELFCGSGNFTEVITRASANTSAVDILAVEASRAALTVLDQKKLSGVRTLDWNLSSKADFEKLSRKVNPKTQMMLMDPPREGAKGVEVLLEKVPSIEVVVSISCDVATFTRDAAVLSRLGFELTEIQALDLFPQTAHVETLAILMKSK